MPRAFEKLKRITTRLQGGAQAAVAVPYELKCECGAKVTGTRRTTWIETECPECCHSVFVLPANVYPSTKSVPSEVLGGTFSERLKMVAGELFPSKTAAGKKSKSKKSKKTSDKTAETQTAERQVTDEPTTPVRRLPQIDVKRLLKRTFTPFRMLMLAMAVVLGLTVYWMSYQRTMESARQVLLKSPEQIQQLLKDGDFVELQSVLQEATDAASTLQRDDPETRRTRNLLAETQAVNSIAASDLLTGFHQAYDDDQSIVDNAARQLTSICDSGMFVFDSWLQDRPGLPKQFLAEFPATPGNHPVEILIPLPALQEFREATEDGRVLFAARISKVVAPKSKSFESWQLRVAPESFVLLTSQDHCDLIGLTLNIDPTIEAILNRQREFVEASDNWQNRLATAVPDANEDAETTPERPAVKER